MTNTAPESFWYDPIDNTIADDELYSSYFDEYKKRMHKYHHHSTVDALRAENARLTGIEAERNALIDTQDTLLIRGLDLLAERDAARAELAALQTKYDELGAAAVKQAGEDGRALGLAQAELAKAREDLTDEQNDTAIIWNVARQLVPDWHQFMVLLTAARNKQPEPNDE
jgi:hypothetical protein